MMRTLPSSLGWLLAGLVLRAGAESAPPLPPPPLLPPTAPPAAVPGSSRSDAMHRGRAAMRDELHGLAEKQFRAALELCATPEERAETVLELARALIAQEQAPQAAQLLGTVPSVARLSPDYRVELARAYLEAGEPAAARGALAATALPATEEGVRLLARCYLQEGRLDEAAASFAAAEELFPDARDLPELLLQWASALIEHGAAADAAPVLDRLMQRRPDSPRAVTARLWLGRIRMETGDWAGAGALLRALALDPGAAAGDRAQAWMTLAGGLEARTNTVEALAALDRAAELGRNTPLEAQTGLARARLLIRSGDWEKGRALLREMYQKQAPEPLVAEAQLYLARWLLDHGQPARAFDEFQHYLEAFEKQGGTADAHAGKGWCLLALQRPAEAAAAFERAANTELVPSRQEEDWFKAGDAHFAAGQFQQALEWYDGFGRRFAGSPRMPDAAFEAAECLRRLGRAAEAETRFAAVERTWAGRPTAQQAALHRVLLSEEQGQWERARAGYDGLLRAYPDCPLYWRALLGRGLVRYRLGDFQNALEDFELLARAGGGQPFADQAWFMQGWCLYLLGRDEAALAVCRAFAEKFPKSAWAADVQFWLGEYAFNHGDYAGAEDVFARLAAQYPAHALADQALFWAGRSAAAGKEFLRAVEYFNRLAKKYPSSARLADARFAQGDALSELGQFAAAILAFDEIIRIYPDSYLAALAWGRKGDCHFTLGAEHPERYDHALLCYQTVRNSPAIARELQMQADYKLGRCLEKKNRPEEAFEQYMKVVYAHVEDREQGRMGAPLWFARAAFDAAAIREKHEQWREAVNVYRRIVEDGGTAAAEAQDRIQRIRREKWMLF